MNFKSCFVLSVTGLIFSVTVNAAPISNLSVTGGTFGGDFSGAFPFIGGPHAFANVGAYNLITDTTTVTGISALLNPPQVHLHLHRLLVPPPGLSFS